MSIVKSFSLSADLVEFLDSQVMSGGYVSGSEYIRELLRAQKERQFTKDLQESEDDLKFGRVVKAQSLNDLR